MVISLWSIFSPSRIKLQLEARLTVGSSLLVYQDLGDWSPDQAVASVFLDGLDDVEGDLTGSTSGVVGSSFVVVDQESVDQNTRVLWRHT